VPNFEHRVSFISIYFIFWLILRLPHPDGDLGLPGRVLASVGNHETWDDPNLEGMMTTMPWLTDLGMSPKNRIYARPYHNSHFIFLDSGGMCINEKPWCSKNPVFAKQMAFLELHLKLAQKNGADHVFVVYHKPSFVQYGHDPLPPKQNPHYVLKKYAKFFNILVFNSHAHTTEQYLVDGINYLVIGGSGTEQVFTKAQNPSSSEKELYWQGKPRVQEYNYLRVKVDGRQLNAELHGIRPPNKVSTVNMVQLPASPTSP